MAQWAVLAAAVLIAVPAWAQPPAAQPPSGPAATPPTLPPELQARYAQIGEEAVGLFKELCLDRFPDEPGTKAYIEGRGATPLSADEVRIYLKDDPGHGWRMTTPLGLYVVTIEHPPVRACAVRRMTPIGMTSAQGYLAAITAFGKARNLTVKPAKQQKATMSGIDITAFASVLADEAGAETEQMILFLSNYHGRVPREFAEDGKPGPGVEVRLVRQPLARTAN